MNSTAARSQASRLWGSSFLFIMVANSIMFMAFEMLLPTLPLFVSHIGGDASQVGLVTGVFMFSAILIRPFTASLAVKVHKKVLLLLGLAICALMTGAYYLAPNVGTILVIRVIHGLGFGLATTYFATIVAEIIPKDRRGEGMGYFGVGETVAVSVGPLIGTSILVSFDFHGLFYGGMGILFFALLMTVLVPRKFGGKANQLEPASTSVKLFEKKVLIPSLLIMLTGVAAGSIMSFFALYAKDQGFDRVAWFFFVIAVGSFLVRLVSGKMYDRLGPAAVLIPASVVMMAGILLITLSGSNFMFLLSGVLYGFGFGAIFPALQTWCIDLVEEHEHEHAMAAFFNFFDLGIGGGSIILGLVASAFSYQAVYYLAIAVMILFLLLCLSKLGKKDKDKDKDKDNSKIAGGG